MKHLLAFLFIFTSIHTFGQAQKQIAIIPEPVSMTATSKQFSLPQNILIEAPAQQEVKAITTLLKDRLTTAAGLKVSFTNASPNATIKLELNKTADTRIGKEGYNLSVTSRNILIRANQPAGLFYGVQTLLQLLPKQIESSTTIKDVEWKLPTVEITDYPRFEWRGLMFDVARHFFTKEEVKKFIDDMVRYKYNLLHLHLSDDEGWRIEIKGLPKLTEVGAWNVKKVGYFGTFSPPTPDEPRNYGGFYTQNDIKEIVQYAKERFVNVLPEIDVPGHSLAAVASYPELSCTPGAEKYVVRSGEPIMDWSRGAPPIGLVDNTLCPANEKVYGFLDKVLTQVAELFPFEYIHVGGDEVSQNFWKKNEQITELMKREGLKDMHEVQGYFMRRVEKIVNSKGKKMMGWDEIVEAGVAPSAGIMSWRGTKYGIEASKKGHEVVMSPTTFAYLDYMQGDSITEPRVYASLRLHKSYQFDPGEGANAKAIKGGQGNIWTEQMYNMRIVQYMIWPRALAIAESVWSPKPKKNWNSFFSKVEQHFERFDAAEIKYSRAAYDPIFTVRKSGDKEIKVELATEVEGLDIHYSFDNHAPDHFYPKYTSALVPPKDAVMLKVITYKGKQPVGRMIAMSVEQLRKRAR
ncbi:MAG TPA: beta-N-acetylhexosaminidase [Segetibacter sp.]|jgi:hexosaminidase